MVRRSFFEDSPSHGHSIVTERPIDSPRTLKVIYIGAGISGIIAAIRFRQAVPGLDLVIYEKNKSVGGTWYENRYPGCACDIPSHAYQLSFESWTEWSNFYATAPEILKYWQLVAKKYDVEKYIHFSHKCVEARWNEQMYKWTVKVENVDTGLIVEDTGDVLMTGTGTLNDWTWPDIPNLHDFEGQLLHSANWDESFDAKDKTVAVIGGGSSGIQIVPALASQVKSMDHYVRGRTWIASQIAEDVVKARGASGNMTSNFQYTAEEKESWRSNSEMYLQYRKTLEFGLNNNYAVTQRGSLRQIEARETYTKLMKERVKEKPEIGNLLIPDFPPLCKRLTPGPGYLEALSSSNVNLITTQIQSVDKAGITTDDGVHRQVDAIICATGFNTSASGGFPIYGRDGINLRVKYRMRPKSYLGLCTDNFPNFFQSLGPNSFQGAGSLLIMLEQIHRYVAQILQRLTRGNVKTIEPKRSQVENFTAFCEEYFKRTVYSDKCDSWYKSSDPEERKTGRVNALWPGSCMHALQALSSPRWEDFNMESCNGNDFGWFGNGWTMCERTLQPSIDDLTWYLESADFLDTGAEGSLEVESWDTQSKPAVNGVGAEIGSPGEKECHGAAGEQINVKFADVRAARTIGPTTQVEELDKYIVQSLGLHGDIHIDKWTTTT